MEIRLSAPKIWCANEPVDFRKAINGLSELVVRHFDHGLENHLFVFYNRAKDKLKLLAYHRNGMLLIYKHLDTKRFTLSMDKESYIELTEQQLTWLLAGLDWITMSQFDSLEYDDYY